MLRRYWSIIAAIAGLILIGASQPDKKTTDSEQSNTKISEVDAQTRVDVGPPTSPPKDEGCKAGKEDRKSELCAQWKAADAANDAAKWAWLQLGLSALGVLGLVITLWFNFRALRIAEDAADETKDALAVAKQSADSAANLVRLSDRNARLELRAYLDFDGVRIDLQPDFDNPKNPDEKGVLLKITIRNYGRTPAANVESSVTPKGRFVEDPNSHAFAEEDRKTLHTIAPSDCFYLRFYWRFPSEIWQKIENDELQIIISIIVTYTDIFEKSHVLRGDFGGRGVKEDFGVIEGTRVST
jgi:hypothetical protein